MLIIKNLINNYIVKDNIKIMKCGQKKILFTYNNYR